MNGLSAASSTEVKYPPHVGANRGVSPESPECERYAIVIIRKYLFFSRAGSLNRDATADAENH